MTQFAPIGPFKVPTSKQPGGKTISGNNIDMFWERHSEYAEDVGCYVFAIRAGKGYTPIYVGKATKGFDSEAFASHKHAKYLQALAGYRKGTPVLFFISYPRTKKGATNKKHIAALEKLLIQQAALTNPRLLNIKNTSVPKWGIAGVVRSTTRKRSKAAKELRRALGFVG